MLVVIVVRASRERIAVGYVNSDLWQGFLSAHTKEHEGFVSRAGTCLAVTWTKEAIIGYHCATSSVVRSFGTMSQCLQYAPLQHCPLSSVLTFRRCN
jgi:hypothetical protein